MRLSLARLAAASAIATLIGALAAWPAAASSSQRSRGTKPPKPAPARKTAVKPTPPPPASNVHLQVGDLKVDVRSVQRSPRLIGDLLRSRDDDYLIMRLHVEAAPGKTLDVPVRATFAVLSTSTPPVKYPVFA